VDETWGQFGDPEKGNSAIGSYYRRTGIDTDDWEAMSVCRSEL
jgi:hypothetical protein